MKKTIAGMALAAIFSMGIITNVVAWGVNQEVKTEITTAFPNIATEAKITSTMKLFKVAASKAKTFNSIANKELTNGSGKKEPLDPLITKNHLDYIATYFDNVKKAVSAIRGFKAKDVIGLAITNVQATKDFNGLKSINNMFQKLEQETLSEKAKKAATVYNTALRNALTSLQSIQELRPRQGLDINSLGQAKVASEFFAELYRAIGNIKEIRVQEFNGNATVVTQPPAYPSSKPVIRQRA